MPVWLSLDLYFENHMQVPRANLVRMFANLPVCMA